MEKKLENNYKLIIEESNEYLKIKLYQKDLFNIYENKYNLNELTQFQLFKVYSSFKEIIEFIFALLDEKKYLIDENNNNELNLVLLSSLPNINNIHFKLFKIKNSSEEVIQLLIDNFNQIKKENIENEIKIREKNQKLINDDLLNLNQKIKYLENEIKNIKEENKINLNNEKEKNMILEKENKELKQELQNLNEIIKILEYDNNIKITVKIKKEDLNKNIQIINYNDKNKNEIEESCILYFNNEKINLTYKYIFKEEGEYSFKFLFDKLLSNINKLFFNCYSLSFIDLSNFNTFKITEMNDMFYNCYNLKYINLYNINTCNVINMSHLFFNCSSLINLNLENFNTEKVINMSNMFYNCSSLTELNLSNFNTNYVIDMSNMFFDCRNLIHINLSNFKTNNVENMSQMFYNCFSIQNLNLSNFITEKVENMSHMFFQCKSLKSLNLSNFICTNVQKIDNIFFEVNKNCEIICNDIKLLNIKIH